MAEVFLGNRREQVANAREDSCRTGLGKTAAVETKKKLGGERAGKQIIFGFHVNVVGEAIVLPQSNVDGAKNTHMG